MEIKNKLAFYHNKAKQYIKKGKFVEARDYLTWVLLLLL